MKRIKLLVICLILVVTFTSITTAIAETLDYTIYLPMLKNGDGHCSIAPTLISPSNGSVVNTLIPEFKWENGDISEVTEVHFLITLHEDDFPVDWVYWTNSYDGSFTQEQYNTTNLDPGTTYYWQVWMKCGEIESPKSSQWTFTTGSDGVIPSAPVLLSPADNTTIYRDDLPVTLKWSPVNGAKEYKVIFSRYDSGSWYISWTKFVSGTEYMIPFSLVQNTWYKWTILSVNDYAIGSSSSRIFKTYW